MAKSVDAKILIVEDEKNIARYIEQSLESFGYSTIDTAVSAEEAIRKAKEMNPDLVLMDIALKGTMDGIEAAEIIKEQLGTPLIYITAYSHDKIVNRAKATRPVGYLLKPFRMKDLQKGVEIALRHR